MKEIFIKALGINKPWFVAGVNFDLAAKRLDINLDFVRGTAKNSAKLLKKCYIN